MMKPEYDVVIIGSGASGGMAAYTLTKLGVRCLMLDAGSAARFRTRADPESWSTTCRTAGSAGRADSRT